MTFTEKRFFDWHEDEISVTLRNCGASYGGGSEVLITTKEDTMSYQETTGALLASGYEKLGTQEAANGMFVTEPTESTEDSVITATTGEFTQVDVEKASTLMSRDYKDPQIVSKPRSVVRRLTPRECERLQGFPDDFTLIGKPEEVEVKDYVTELDEDGNERKVQAGTHTEIGYYYTDRFGRRKRCTDSARYKALGNSIAVGYANQQSGYWCWLARRTVAQYEHQVTVGSLFDGIGGFPLAFAACGAIPVWASEIEDFCIEVTRRRFPDPDDIPVD